jgi:cation/acetate symporter
MSPYGVPWVNIVDVNRDGILQWNEFRIHADVVVLATPEIAGLPYVIAGLVAAGGLAAALSTADGLLLALANALSHDVYYKMIDRDAPTKQRLIISRVLLLIVAVRRPTPPATWAPTSCSSSPGPSPSPPRASSPRW